VSETASEAPTVHGPVDFVLLQFPADRLTGAVAPRLVELVEAGVIRLFDLVVISKSMSGAVEMLELRDSPIAQDFRFFSGANSGLINDEDVREAADAMDAGTVAALLVYENSWAVPFVAAAREAGGDLVASGRIPAQVVMEVLDALERAEPART
jgi:dihydroorotase-like cyclic amidohydrolase